MTDRSMPLVEYHIVPHDGGWDIERDDAFIGSVVHDVQAAIALATAAARRDQDHGLDAMVCVQETDGHCRKVWP